MSRVNVQEMSAMEHDTDDWITESEAAGILGVDPRTLAKAVARGNGPPAYAPLGTKRRYRRAEVLAHLAASRVAPAAGGASA